MDLDEAIEDARQKGAGTGPEAEHNRQLAEWLEELTTLRKRLVRPFHWPAGEGIAECPSVRAWARDLVMRFGRPVYLVGSALHCPSPRDVDIRVVLTDDEFRARWGDPAKWWGENAEGWRRYAADMGKLGKQGSIRCTLNIDLQVQSLSSTSEYAKNRRVRLDDVLDIEPAAL
jgi:hypothetical protein